MSTITAILPSPRKPGRFEIVVDGRAEATVSLEIIERLHLAVGSRYASVQQAVADEAAALHTYDRALNMLALRARSAAELKRQLVRKGEPAPLVDAAIARLRANGFLDDEQFARQFARSKVLGAGTSRRRLQQELGRRGVSREATDEAIADVFQDEAVDEDAMVEQVARKKLRSLLKLEPRVRDRRLYAFLARRGYDSDQIRRAVQTVTGDAPDAMVDDRAPLDEESDDS